ncbi:hypothetical protein JH06_5752 [Blastocystis sp. subtype 4]|uniref:hypothetical protein n=1 Tax=Blastocystis sp. subtype 4 TaxID=944170 RepID=UPI00071132CE|nr:hypothetical protein JH06_5752 [Blastocystis sp. subtype 4]KNB41305.1 hypothetical protein JH06_5752 [Blastocystis sp. subtype 4]|eukprot:XP_014524748.1 hypothetical protein JH06_5752 [Blastocystis sp. subtype 4]
MTRYTVTNWDSYLSIPLYVTALTVAYSSCHDNNINVVDLSSFKFLRSVVIGDFLGLNWLESVSIGYDCFWDGSTDSLLKGSEFKIVNCPQLKSLSIGSRSFRRYNGFELSQLPQLKSVGISYNGCFRYARNAVFRDLPSLESIHLLNDAFRWPEYELNISDLPKLTILYIQQCLVGSTSTKTDVIPYYYKNTLIMRNLPSLRTLSLLSGDIFENMGFVTLENVRSPLNIEVSGSYHFQYTHTVEVNS